MSNIMSDVFRALVFMIPLQAGQWLFALQEKKRDGFGYRVAFFEILYLALPFLIALAINYETVSDANPAIYIVVYLYTFIMFWGCFRISCIEVAFVTSCGYALQHIGMSITNILYYVLGKSEWNIPQKWILELLIQCMVLMAAYLILIRQKQLSEEYRERDPHMITIAFVILFSCLFLNTYVYYYEEVLGEQVQIFSYVICKAYAIICCILAIYIEYAVSYINYMNKQQEFMEQMIKSQQNSIQLTQESVSIINRKCHDIKYQLRTLQFTNNEDKHKEQIQELQKAVSIYDAIYHTGNEALNLVLREKTLLCDEYEIQFSCMADGTILDFIPMDDLYVLLGNALDNAIESVMKETDVTKRIISLYIGLKNGMKCIHLENYCNEQLLFQNGLPITTKEDKTYHGFGMQSMKYLAEKYNGNMVVKQQEDFFHLNVLFPTC